MMRRLRLLAAVTVASVAALPSVAQADSTWYVGSAADGCPAAQFSDLTMAVTFAQPHDTIRICPGTYTVGPPAGTTPTAVGLQGLVIDKPLTIIGAGASKVTIEPTTNLVSGTSRSDNLRDAFGNVVTVTNTSPGDTSDWDVNPTISGVTISNGGFLVDAGIAFNNAAGAITDSTIEPFSFSGAPPVTSGPNYGWGVVASDNYAVTPQGAFERDVSVSGDLITDYGGGGVLIDGSESSQPIYFRSGVSTTGAITGNVIAGASDPTRAQQYGLQVNAGARATISGNVISGNLGATAGTATNPGTGVGVLLTDADVTSRLPGSSTTYYTTVTGDDLTGNGYGVFNGTADFPAAAPGDPNQVYPIDVNGTGTAPSNLPSSLTNTAQSTAAAPVTVSYQVPGAPLQAASRRNYFGPDQGVPGGPSNATDDGISESTTTGTDSVVYRTASVSPPTTPYPTPAAPGLTTDLPPTASWRTPDGINQTTLTAGLPNELLVIAGDDFGVASVDINADGTDLGTTTLPPYETSWTPPDSLIGHTVPLVAKVTDSSGQVTTAAIDVEIVAPAQRSGGGGGEGGGGGGAGGGATPPSPPTISLPPTFGWVAGSSLTITPTFTGPVANVVYELDGKVVCTSTDAPFACTATGLSPGDHKLVIVATATNGLSSSLTRTIDVAKATPRSLRIATRLRHGRLEITGRLMLPSNVTAKAGYSGKVMISYGRHRMTVRLTSTGSLAATGKRAARGTKLTVKFEGNLVLKTLVETIRVA